MQTKKTYDTLSRNLITFSHTVGGISRTIFTPAVLFILILGLGIFARVWEYPQLPPGLNQDEATIGIEAYSLLHFGVDRNGISYPVNFISWGDGMDALYGYVLIPFVAFGLTPLTVRLPVLLAGILTLPLVYFIGKRSAGEAFGLLSMFLLAISPWHILMSRWGINENILPFVFCLGFACMMLSSTRNSWFIAASALFGLSLYAYGATYVAVPVFLACAIPILIIAKRVSKRDLIIGLVVFTLLLVPILLFVLINAFGWDSIQLGPVTIPRMPVQPRFLNASAASQVNPLMTMLNNIRGLVKLLLVYQSDQHVWNSVEPFGYMYSFSLPLAIIGSILLFPRRDSPRISEILLVLSWLLASLTIGVFQYANINRVYLVFIPVILCIAFFLKWLGERSKVSFAAMILVYLTSFFIFTNVYHGKPYREQANQAFFPGLIPALEVAQGMGAQPICVTDNVNMPYIYAMFNEKMSPTTFFEQAEFENPGSQIGYVRSLGRYTFGLKNCIADPGTIYVLKNEKPPDNGISYRVEEFGDFRVFSP